MIPAPPPAIVAQAPSLPPIPAEIELALRKRIAKVPGSAVVIARRLGDRAIVDGIGSQGGPKITQKSRFALGAISEAITGLLLADAVRRGEVRLDEPIDERPTPGLQPPVHGGKHITFRDLATHRSGLPNVPLREALQPYATYDRAAVIALVNAAKPAVDPGTRYEPSNLDYALLGMLLADRAGTPYAQLVHDRIFVPLDMPNTMIDGPDDGVVAERAITGVSVAPWRWNAFAPEGGVRSTADDLLNFVGALFGRDNGPLAQDARLAATPIASAGADTGIGLGWLTDRKTGAVYAGGYSYGSTAFVGVVPQRDVAVILLANVGLGLVDTTLDDLGIKLLTAGT